MRRKKFLLISIIIGVLVILIGSIYIFREKKEVSLNVFVINPGFESLDDSGRVLFWRIGKGWSIDFKDPYEGKVCMEAKISWRWLEQEIPVYPERHYVLRAYVKSDISKKYNTFLTLECLNKEGEIVHKNWGIVSASPDWQLREVRICTPGDTRKIRIRLAKRQGIGSVWFDNLEIDEISAKPILNGDFEELDKSNRLLFWREDPKGGWSIEKKNPFGGKVCMEATVSWSFLSQEVPVRGKSYYLLKARIKSDIIIPKKEDYQNTFLTLECLDKNNKVISRNWGIVNAVSSWQLREVAIGTPEGTKLLRIKLAKRQGEGSVWFDDVELVRLPSYMRIYLVRKILQDKPFFIFYGIIYFTLFFLLLRMVIKELIQKRRN